MQTDEAETFQRSMSGALPIPFTFAGTVAFSRRSASCFLLGWLCAAAIASATCLWFIHLRWIPVIESTIEALPADVAIAGGMMKMIPEGKTIQKQNGFISLVITSAVRPQGNMTSDFQVAITPEEIRFNSLLGYLPIPYPLEARLSLTPSYFKAWWRAREALFTVLAFCLIAGALLSTWILLATLYFIPIAITNYFAERRNEFWATWRLAGSLLLPGALIMTLSILLYGFHLLGFLGLLVATALHIIIAWIYGLGSIKHIPRNPSFQGPGTNPFSGADNTDTTPQGPKFGD